VILDTKGNVFGGFTPVELESGKLHWKADDSFWSFVFTLKNPHDIPARRLALKPEAKWGAICCDSGGGPCFGNDIRISNNYNANTWCVASLGNGFTTDTGLDGKTVFTGSQFFHVKEIEVFEIIE
jgi:hypothetical protein